MTQLTVKRLMIIHFYLFSSAAVAATVVVADKIKFNQHDTSSHHHAEYRSKHIKWVQVWNNSAGNFSRFNFIQFIDS